MYEEPIRSCKTFYHPKLIILYHTKNKIKLSEKKTNKQVMKQVSNYKRLLPDKICRITYFIFKERVFY